ncbi:unnamed protein product [Clonostachys rosea]|uniref:Thymidylate kinase n=1 Tax=Bionectria ochroleuca TaxID=29856 RepID=A0ABY6UZJ6_BIOOC|nr:unnamed protein product [Clonostachys rosea]
MATITRQPFAPLDGSRLQSLTNLKNRQNGTLLNTRVLCITPSPPSRNTTVGDGTDGRRVGAMTQLTVGVNRGQRDRRDGHAFQLNLTNTITALPSPSAGKRKAELLDLNDDAENVDPLMFAKRVKPLKGQSGSTKDVVFKPANFILNTKPSVKPAATPISALPLSNSTSASRRTIRSPAKISTGISKPTSFTAPAGRSPPRGKRSGLLSNKRRTAGPYSRVDPPSFRSAGAAPFSLDAALKGTIPSYAARPSASKPASNPLNSDMKASWFFDIHEDTEEQEMTNMLQHSTCVLDISSDEESELKARREGREDKENVPPVDDVSQTSGRRVRPAPRADDMVVEKERVALGALNTADFYAEGLDESSVILVPVDEDAETDTEEQMPARAPKSFVFAQETTVRPTQNVPSLEAPIQIKESIDALMTKSSEPGSSKAAVLQPIEGTGDSFELWESGSAKDDTAPSTPTQ